MKHHAIHIYERHEEPDAPLLTMNTKGETEGSGTRMVIHSPNMTGLTRYTFIYANFEIRVDPITRKFMSGMGLPFSIVAESDTCPLIFMHTVFTRWIDSSTALL